MWGLQGVCSQTPISACHAAILLSRHNSNPTSPVKAFYVSFPPTTTCPCPFL